MEIAVSEEGLSYDTQLCRPSPLSSPAMSFNTPKKSTRGMPLYDTFSPPPKSPGSFYSDSTSSLLNSEKKLSSLKVGNSAVKAVQKSSDSSLRASYTPSPKPSARQKDRVDLIDSYLTKEIEPIMAALVQHLLLINPIDIRGALLTYLMALEQNSVDTNSKSKFISKVGGGIDPEASSKRVELLRKANPLVTQLSHACVVSRPDDVVKFLISTLEKWENLDEA